MALTWVRLIGIVLAVGMLAISDSNPTAKSTSAEAQSPLDCDAAGDPACGRVRVRDNRTSGGLLSSRDQDHLDECVDNLLMGPGKKKLKIKGHEFNCAPSVGAWQKIGNIYQFQGKISHHLSMRADDQVYFSFMVAPDGEISEFQSRTDRGGIMATVNRTVPLSEIHESLNPAYWTAESFSRVTGQAFNGGWDDVSNLIMASTMARLSHSMERSSGGRLKNPRGGLDRIYWYVDIPGRDIQKIPLSGRSATAYTCARQCEANQACSAWTFAKARANHSHGNCWLKSSAPPAETRAPMVSGRVIRRN